MTAHSVLWAACGPLSRCLLSAGAALLLALPSAPAHADAASLRARHAELQETLRSSAFQQSLHIDSVESGNSLQGDIYAVLDHPFETVKAALQEPGPWCDIMILPFNTKYCHAVERPGEERLVVRIGRKYNQPVEQAFRLEFQFRNLAASAQHFESRLNAREGPFGTRDYRIRVAGIPLEGGRTFLHMSYAYAAGTTGRLAMQAYLATAGADKVGFTVTGKDANGQPQLIGGVRGAVERNAMRYYLAIDAFLDSLRAPEHQRAERRIQNWFTASERYPRQLREMDRSTYVSMKRAEVERQETAGLQ
jgi:hypothetical protein